MKARVARLQQILPALSEDDHFFLMAGQPPEIRREWEWAMGLTDDRS